MYPNALFTRSSCQPPRSIIQFSATLPSLSCMAAPRRKECEVSPEAQSACPRPFELVAARGRPLPREARRGSTPQHRSQHRRSASWSGTVGRSACWVPSAL